MSPYLAIAGRVEFRAGGPTGPEGFAQFLVEHGPGPDGPLELPPPFVFFREPAPFAGVLHTDGADSPRVGDPDVDLLTISGGPTTPGPVMIEPRGEWLGPPRGREDFGTVPVAASGTAPGLLGELGSRVGPGPPVADAPTRAFGLAGNETPRNDSALADAGEPSGGTSAEDKAGVIEGAIADVEAALARGADLLASFSPFDRVALERTIDRFLGEVGDLGEMFSNLEVTASLLPNLMAAAGAVAVFEAARRRARGPADDAGEDAEADGDAGPPGLPGLPRGWAMEER